MSNSPIHFYNSVSSIEAIEKVGVAIAKSGMFGVERVEQGFILALQCFTEGLPPMELCKRYHLIQGKLSMRADAMLALYRERGGRVKWVKYDADAAQGEWTFEGQTQNISYTANDAKLAGMLPAKGGGWAKFPAEMLRARCISKSVRMLCPEVVTGTYTPDEVEGEYIKAPQPQTERQIFYQPVTVTEQVVKHEEQLATTVTIDVPPLANVTQAVELPTPVEGEAKTTTLANILTAANLTTEGYRFLIDKEWIQTSLDNLAPLRLDKILAKPEAFLNAIRKHTTI